MTKPSIRTAALLVAFLFSGMTSATAQDTVNHPDDVARVRPGNVQHLLRGLSWDIWKR
jgi:hypothetical protein